MRAMDIIHDPMNTGYNEEDTKGKIAHGEQNAQG